MKKPTRFQEGFDAGAVACVVTLLRVDGWRGYDTAKELLSDFNPSIKHATDDDLAVLREFKLIPTEALPISTDTPNQEPK